MASMRDIKRRKGSIQSTQQITKAMKLVSTVKLQKAKGRAEQTDPYFQYMYRTVSSILAHSGNIDHPYLRSGESKKKAIVVLTSNRGLAGGYNANVVKLITESDDVAKEDVVIYAVGRKGIEILERKGYHIEVDASEIMENPTYPDAAALCKRVLDDFAEGKMGEIYLAYTHFKNTVSQEAQLIRMLPVEAVASENGARMQAMDSATSNAEEMIEDLSLKYNRARQGSITQELTEIIAGANAIE